MNDQERAERARLQIILAAGAIPEGQTVETVAARIQELTSKERGI
jgi:hypothetical protein